jgi:hypothetical protein
MRAAIFVLGIFLFVSASARAQGPAGHSTAAKSGSRPSLAPQHDEYDAWQIALGYQYNRDNLLGSAFSTHGLNISFARFFKRWLAVEADLGTGFLGNTGKTSTPPNLAAKSLFVGAGPRIVFRNRTRYEPWVHVAVGFEHYRFSQTGGLLGSNNALAGPAGGGVDIYLTPRAAVRVEADAFYSRFFSANQRSFQAVGGFVLNF